MSDETKGATVTNGCAHNNVNDNPALLMAPCPDCAALVDLPTWRKLHPPAEPPKSWVDSKSDGDPGKKGLMREAVEECCRLLETFGCVAIAINVRRAMLEPKA